MGIFFNKILPFNEADDEEVTDYTKSPEDLQAADPAGGSNDTSTDEETGNSFSDGANDRATEQNEPSDNTPSPDDSSGDTGNEGSDDFESEDYTVPDDGGEGDTTDYTEEGDGEGENPEDEGSDDTEGGDMSDEDTSDDSSNEDEIKKLEEELFSTLSPAQIDIKSKELKHRYIEMFEVTDNLITKVNDIPKQEEYIRIIQFVSDKLSELRDMISDYISDTYSTLTYMENAINYNKFLATLNGINRILDEINVKEEKN